jgi:type IV secretory pathway VirB2 component (pilin)
MALGTIMHLTTTSLSDPPAGSPVAEGIFWMQSAALGTASTVVAVIAVAAVGLLMLSGRLELRRGLAVVAGCFILFGASAIAAALTGSGGELKEENRPQPGESNRLRGSLRAPDQPASAYDPYAGASVPAAQ